METSSRCYVCDSETNRKEPLNVFDLLTKQSKRPITDILKSLQNGVETICARDGSGNCVLCDNCISCLNKYDEACILAQRVEKQLKELILRTIERYKRSENPVTTPDADPIDAIHVPAFLSEWDERDAEMESEKYSPDPEPMIESEMEEIDSDDSFVWPKFETQRSKRESDREKKKLPFMYSCIDCPADFNDKHEMQLHTASHKRPQYRCGICNMRIANGRESIEHEHLHAYVSDSQCIFCEQSFEKSSMMAHHMQSHNGDIKTVCYICGKMISTSAMDGTHIKRHLGIKEFECATCSRKFVDKEHLHRHFKTHTGERPFKCPYPECGKRFSSANNLKEHTFIHTPDKRPSFCRDCSICGKTFRRTGLLAQHYKRVHNSSSS